MLRTEAGEFIHCIETVTGEATTGKLLLSAKQLRVDLYSYTGRFHVDSDGPVHLIAETGDCVSLHDCVDASVGTTSRNERTVHHHSLLANLAIVGHDPWLESDRVKRVSFSVKHSTGLLRNQKRIDALRSGSMSEEHFRIFEDRANGVNLKARYAARWDIGSEGPPELWPIFEIEFDDPMSIHQYISCVTVYVDFLSFCLGVVLRPENIQVDRLSYAEMEKALSDDKYRPAHDVYYIWRETEIDSRDLWLGGSPADAWDEEGLAALRACLVTWTKRAGAWGKSYVMMRTSIALKKEISAERLINACRWFEEIPNAQSINLLSPEHIDAITVAAASKAKELGHLSLDCQRISASIARIKEESAADRFSRLLTMVRDKFGHGVVPDNALAHLKRAIQFRGKTAHGHFDPVSEEDYRAFSKSTRAMEALCYLLTALDLPIASNDLSRVGSNPVVRDYREAYE